MANLQPIIEDFFNGLCCIPTITCYQKIVGTDLFTPQSRFPAKIALTGTGTLQETVHNNVYVTGAEADGQYSLRSGGGNDVTGSGSSFAIAFNFSIDSNFTPYKIYSQKLLGIAGTTYKGGFWSRERASGPKAIFSFKILDGATVLATGNTGSMTNTYTNYLSNSFVMPASGEVMIEIFTELNGNASGNDPVLDDIGLALVNSTITNYKKVSDKGVDTYYKEDGTVLTGTDLTTLQTEISNGTATEITCTF